MGWLMVSFAIVALVFWRLKRWADRDRATEGLRHYGPPTCMAYVARPAPAQVQEGLLGYFLALYEYSDEERMFLHRIEEIKAERRAEAKRNK
ncbi:hypothetical protein QBC39DRAFT_370431 [Podospora conica]|nr:hypothetical protein QBC39DRAFT_370431 [Schizothecium conicum]